MHYTPFVATPSFRERLALPVLWLGYRFVRLSFRIGGSKFEQYAKQVITRAWQGLAP